MNIFAFRNDGWEEDNYEDFDNFFDDMGVPAKAVGCSALRSRSFLHSVSERLRRCSIA